jgi:EAL domain-containing protein (putative c-di-GMP-specific phosphodiesterase class I)
VTSSIGIAMAADRADDLIRDADLAMYHAKAAGKGRYATFQLEMHAAVVERSELEVELQGAAGRNELVLHYQPIVALDSEEIIGVEALVRWQHPTRGLVSPDVFIPLAEEVQLMPELGRWIIAEACREVASWGSLRPMRLEVNVSAVDLQSPDVLAADVAAALEQSGLPADALVLEITETALMRDVTDTIRCLRELKELGVLLAVDDFGTGYSSLDYLRRFPIDILKIDKAFVDDLTEDTTLAQAMIDLGASFGLEVIAEGIEDDAQHATLLALGCRSGQGYHFSRPLPAKEMRALLARAAASVAH